MTTTALPGTALEIRLASVPEGLPEPRHFTLSRTSLAAPGPGQVLVRNRYFLVFPGLRTLIGGRTRGLRCRPWPPGTPSSAPPSARSSPRRVAGR